MPIPQLPPAVLADMALRNPEMAARYAAQTGMAPPPVPAMKPAMLGNAPAPIPAPNPMTGGGGMAPQNLPAGEALAGGGGGVPMNPPVPMMKPPVAPEQGAGAVDPNQVGALLAGVQGTVPRGQGQAPATGIAGYSGPSGGDFLQILLRNPQLAAGLAQYLPGQRF